MRVQAKPLSPVQVIRTLSEAGLLLAYRGEAPSLAFEHCTSDSRLVQNSSLFVAYKGIRFDPHELIPQLKGEFGQLGFIVEDPEAFAKLGESWGCLVTDSRDALAHLCAERYGQPQRDLCVFGVTGTNGKTSTAWFLRQLLAKIQRPCVMIGTLGIDFGDEELTASHTTPDPEQLFQVLAYAKSKGLRYVVMEVSSHAIRQRRLGPLRFDAGGFTSFSRDHLDFHPSMADYFAAKWEFISRFLKPLSPVFLSTGILSYLPEDAPQPRHWLLGPSPEGEQSKMPRASWQSLSQDLYQTSYQLQWREKSWQGQLPFGADFAVANALMAFLMIEALYPGALQVSDLANLQPVPGRFELLEPAKSLGFSVCVDYAHTPDALAKTLSKLREGTQGKLWLVFGCGGDRDRGKRPLMGELAAQLADAVVVTSDNPRTENPESIIQEIIAGMPSSPQYACVEREEAIRYAIDQLLPGDSLLIAGKGHENYQEIGKQRFPFDDREKASAYLKKKSEQRGGK